ncbi:MAG TPA: MATE family efflux transporter [Hungateiclostridium thermocellum]|uniref:Probable multidrug resistance protein NorM n=3 Tax=Acetivibrio thermocellus TaxID=1515 RepID=A3DHS9_ACET2|nr:MATE family efflux transporter [Acetivibrio thermocellus]CDG36826.1 MATE efflux family protein [Acetivibrio thermocellus BC1]ABN53508.1 MATE efflux family protein [Acetivibrio thermocellus ATCC 27405]ADU75957.1 MATE efflux family protein [Acetivibrio thermocellus DSM 1313]ALX09992.1 MATE efflux family protein [Acetivibrio thermocellus AD2]ANV77766.1 MATE efflux family protein [Acetivibrio thermocellus DSM 2360]
MLQFLRKRKWSQKYSKQMIWEVISLSWPAFIELVMSTLFSMIDMIMVGRLNSAAITAVGLTTQPFMVLLAIFSAVNVGTTTIVAWNIGAGNTKKANEVARQSIILNFIMGIIISTIGVFMAHDIVVFMGAEADTVKDATVYFQIVSAGLVFQAVNMGVTAALRGAGETTIPMIYNVGSNLFNVLGNYLLIFGKLGLPKLGVAGAAISTSVSRFLACVVGLCVVFFLKWSAISIRLKGSYRINFDIAREIFSIGLPSAMEQFVVQGGLMMFARTVSSLGTVTFAAHQIGLSICGLTFSPSMAFGVAGTTLVGQSLGANDEERAKRYADIIHHMAIAVACFMGLMFILFSYPLACLYTEDLKVAAMASIVLKIMALAQPGQSTQLSLAGVLRGAGDTMFPLYSSIAGIWGFRVVVAYIFVSVFRWGLIGAWVALVLDQYTRAAIVYFRYASGKWKYVKARNQEVEKMRACS